MSRAARSLLIRFMPSIFLASLLLGCSPSPNTGPGEIHWDRETCEHCQMVISERRHAVQIRLLGDQQTHAFDDLGCGLLWLDGQGIRAGIEKGPEVWAKRSLQGEWIDGREAEFSQGLTTPMAYGFGLADAGMSLREVQIAVHETERLRRSGGSDRIDPQERDDDETRQIN